MSSEQETNSSAGAQTLSDTDNLASWGSDPTHRVGQLNQAKKKPLSVKPTATVSEAVTLMLTHDFSQLPVMTSTRNVRGMFSWRSLAQRFFFKQNCVYVADAMEQPTVIPSTRSLFEAARLIAESDSVLIKQPDGSISGILTSYDLSVTFRERSEPFLLLEQIENHIRNRIEAKIPSSELHEVPDGFTNALTDATKLGFGDYVRILQRPDWWQRIGLPLDQTVFIRELDEVRRIRNKVMHFNPNCLESEHLRKLREFSNLLRQVRRLRTVRNIKK